jgi:thiosulfate/3-mercaptopyruvate sulfurtransferase
MSSDYAHPEIIISPEELKALIDRKAPHLSLVDVRPRLQYYRGHLPRAVQVWRPAIEDKGHFLPGMMAPKAQVEKLLSRLGVANDDTIVIYSDKYDQARLWWLLAYYGFPLERLKLLNGGINAWKARGYPLKILPPWPKRTDFRLPGRVSPQEPLCCTLPEVKKALADPQKVVLDVRTKEEYLGEKQVKHAAKPGRIPGVTFIEWKETLVKEGANKGYFESAQEIRDFYSARGVTPDKHIYIY